VRARALALVAAVVLLAAPVALSLAAGGDTRASATGPLRGDVDYTGTLKQGNDQDWYFFYVPSAGDHLHWTVTNTTPKTQCVPPGVYGCHIYATLIDDNGKQVGGDNSSAGISGANPGETQTIDWTFDRPGRYYLGLNEDGDGGSYSFRVTPASGLSDSAPGAVQPGGAVQPALKVAATARGRTVSLRVTVPASGSTIRARLLRAGRSVGARTVKDARKGVTTFAVSLTKTTAAVLRRRHRLGVTLRVTLTPPGGGRVERASRALTLRG